MDTTFEFDDTFKHEIILQVPFYMTDYGGGVYHSRYLDLYQQARDAFFTDAGFPYKDLMAKNFYIVIVDIHAAYKKAVNFFEDIMIRTRLASVEDKSFLMVQEMWRKNGEGETLCNRLEVTHVCVTPERKAVSIPDFFIEKLIAFQKGTGA